MSDEKIFTRREVLEALFARWTPRVRVETVVVSEALGRVSARDVFAVHDLPVVRASAMDGVGVASVRFAGGAPDTSSWREGVDFVRADTGDDFDDRFDAVIQIESVTFLDGGGLSFSEDVRVSPGMNVRPSGSTVKRGELITRAGTRLRPFDLAALVMGGASELHVTARPVVAFIPTGSELVAPGEVPERGQNIDCNSIMAEKMLVEMGARPVTLPIVRDEPAAIRAAIDGAARIADIIVVNAGSSKGGEDCNTAALRERGEFINHYVLAAPGRPMSVALLDGKPVINVPGPPLAAYFVMDWCVSAVVARALGIGPPARKRVSAELTGAIRDSGKMELLRRLRVEETDGAYTAAPLSGHGERTVAVLTSGGQYVTAPGAGELPAGTNVEIELLR
ncbi:MAG: molybdopterin molybdotransferase MoeA [Oscillospiraceae bacterium]|jgi:molybdopterin molybdotransferase/putative molybdopterin biosynthesis protein|nr:molybdopterin molybdotransferase MoeA [Oscillospiraceae bacterium]